MRNSKYLKVDKDVLIQWIYDDDNYLNEDYQIIVDTLRQKRMFAQAPKTGTLGTVTGNATNQQLFLLNDVNRKWGVVDENPATNKYLFLQYVNFPGNVPFKYDIVRVHFPINYTFGDKLGFVLSIGLYNRRLDKTYSLSNFYYDKTDLRRSSELHLGTPFQFQEKSWGKYIELQVPSTNSLVNDYLVHDNQVLSTRPASIHANLVGDELDMLSMESPLNVGFSFLTKFERVGTQLAYFATDPFKTTLPVKPEYETLAVDIVHSDQGDYFEIMGAYNNTKSEFGAFVKKAALEGRRYVVTYEISTYEKNLLTRQETQVVTEDFDKPVVHRPIIQFSTTTATLEVSMKLMNTLDGSIIERKSSYSMLQDEVGKYSNFLTKINTVNVSKPKIYNGKADQINLTVAPSSGAKTVVTVNYPLMYERYNVLVKNKSEQVNDTTWYSMGQSQILLYPFDNVVVFAVGKGKLENGIEPFKIPAGSAVTLSFTSDQETVTLPLFTDTNMTDLANGIVVFKIPQTRNETLAKMYAQGFDQFYLNLQTVTGDTTVLYAGRFIFYHK